MDPKNIETGIPWDYDALVRRSVQRRSKRIQKERAKLRCTPDELRFIHEYLQNGNNAAKAYWTACGGNFKYRAQAAQNMLRRPSVQAELERVRDKEMDRLEYGLKKAMAELDDAIELAKEVKNPNALVQATKLRSQLNGLLIERHEHKITRFDHLDMEQREAALHAVQDAIGKAKLTSMLS